MCIWGESRVKILLINSWTLCLQSSTKRRSFCWFMKKKRKFSAIFNHERSRNLDACVCMRMCSGFCYILFLPHVHRSLWKRSKQYAKIFLLFFHTRKNKGKIFVYWKQSLLHTVEAVFFLFFFPFSRHKSLSPQF